MRRRLLTIAEDSPGARHWIDKKKVLWMQRSVTQLTEKGRCATGHGVGECGGHHVMTRDIVMEDRHCNILLRDSQSRKGDWCVVGWGWQGTEN